MISAYRLCVCVGVVRILYSKVYDFLHTNILYGSRTAVMYTWIPLLAPCQQYWQLGHLVTHVCYKANSDVCHTAAILDAAHRSVQQPAHNLVTTSSQPRRCINLPFTKPFLPYIASSEYWQHKSNSCYTLCTVNTVLLWCWNLLL